MKIIFAGTPSFAEIILEALLHSSHQLVAIYTQPDRPAGRGLKVVASPVKQLALTYRLPVRQPISLKDEHEQQVLADFHADVMVVAAYGLLLPAAVLTIPKWGCINIHSSLLPRWRGAAPIQRAIQAGDTQSGISIMQMDIGLDTGPILLQREYTLAPQETAQSLHDHLATLGASALLETLALLEEKQIHPQVQDTALATYAQKIVKEEALIDWARPAKALACEIRAFNPWPVSYTFWQEKRLRIWLAEAIPAKMLAAPRTLLHASPDSIEIATGEGALRLLQMQLPGGGLISATDFYNAHHTALKEGELFL